MTESVTIRRSGPLLVSMGLLLVGIGYLYLTFASGMSKESQYLPIFIGTIFLALMVYNLLKELTAARKAMVATPAAGTEQEAAKTQTQLAKDPRREDTNDLSSNNRSVPTRLTLIGTLLLVIGFAFVATQVDYALGTFLYVGGTIVFLSPGKKKIPWIKICLLSIGSVIFVRLVFVGILNMSLPTILTGL